MRAGDSVWFRRGPDWAEGSRVRITGADGSCLKVELVRRSRGRVIPDLLLLHCPQP